MGLEKPIRQNFEPMTNFVFCLRGSLTETPIFSLAPKFDEQRPRYEKTRGGENQNLEDGQPASSNQGLASQTNN